MRSLILIAVALIASPSLAAGPDPEVLFRDRVVQLCGYEPPEAALRDILTHRPTVSIETLAKEVCAAAGRLRGATVKGGAGGISIRGGEFVR